MISADTQSHPRQRDGSKTDDKTEVPAEDFLTSSGSDTYSQDGSGVSPVKSGGTKEETELKTSLPDTQSQEGDKG